MIKRDKNTKNIVAENLLFQIMSFAATNVLTSMRQLDGYFRSFSNLTLNINATAVVTNYFMNDRQS